MSIDIKDRVCFHCKDRSSSKYCRLEGKVYCNKHCIQIRRHGKIKEITLKDTNTFEIDETNAIVKIHLRDKERNIVAECIVDIDDWEKVDSYTWTLQTKGLNQYAFNRKRGRKPIHLYIHKIITGTSADKVVDHIDGNGLNNRKSNLRVTTQQLNLVNKRRLPRNTSGVTGVSWDKVRGKWVAQIGFKGENFNLGTFDNIEDAKEVRRKAEIDFFGEHRRDFESRGLLPAERSK